jgi:hypothetical protein
MTCGRSVVSPGTPVLSTNKVCRHDITEILLKVALNTIKPNQTKPLTNIIIKTQFRGHMNVIKSVMHDI